MKKICKLCSSYWEPFGANRPDFQTCTIINVLTASTRDKFFLKGWFHFAYIHRFSWIELALGQHFRGEREFSTSNALSKCFQLKDCKTLSNTYVLFFYWDKLKKKIFLSNFPQGMCFQLRMLYQHKKFFLTVGLWPTVLQTCLSFLPSFCLSVCLCQSSI